MSRILLTIALACVASSASCAEADDPAARETVVLLHGLGRTDGSMRALGRHLEEAGFRVQNFDYPSTQAGPEELIADLGERVAACCGESAVLHFVGHSLGGILARAYLARGLPENAGRLVMLAPPNQGSEIVDAVGDTALFRWTLGPTAQRLGTDPNSLPNRLPPPPVEFGVIAGSGSVNPLGSLLLPEDDDGTVSIARTRLDGMADFLVVESSHSFIMKSGEVAEQVVHFLRSGRFRHGGEE